MEAATTIPVLIEATDMTVSGKFFAVDTALPSLMSQTTAVLGEGGGVNKKCMRKERKKKLYGQARKQQTNKAQASRFLEG